MQGLVLFFDSVETVVFFNCKEFAYVGTLILLLIWINLLPYVLKE